MVTSREVRLLAEDPGAGAVGDDARGHDDRRRATRAEPDTRRRRAGRGRGGIVLVHSASLTLTCSFIPAAQCPGTPQMK